MQDTYDPFSFLLSEIHEYDAGKRDHWDPRLRQHYLDLLLADEAEEIAWGRRHLTIVHGELIDEFEAEILDDVFDLWSEVANTAEWSRLGGISDSHLTLTLADARIDVLLATATDVAIRMGPSRWQLVATAIVD